MAYPTIRINPIRAMGDKVACERCISARTRDRGGMAKSSLDDALDAFSSFGGVIGGDELAEMLRPVRSQPMSWIARLIVNRGIVNFSWHARTMIPLFQFEGSELRPRPAVDNAIRELADVYDDEEIACWFARPNEWLDRASPLAALATRPESLVSAARADRFVARG